MKCQQCTVSPTSPRPTAETHKAILIAAIDQAILTSTTVAIVDDRLHAHSVASLELLNTFANLLHNTAELVAEGQRHLLASNRMR